MTPASPLPTDRASLERVCEVEFIRGSGPGGQHRNKVETGIRLTHPPSGLVIMATERRSQSMNRDLAFKRLAAKLEALQKPVIPRKATTPPQGAVEARLRAKKLRGRQRAARGRVDHE